MISEYAAYYGGPPAAGLAWPLFLALCHRTPLFEARHQLTAHLATAGAVGAAFGGDKTGAQELLQAAYPVKNVRPIQTWIKNQAAEA